MPSFATYFLVYEVLKNKFFDKDSESAKSNSYSKFIGTAAAGATGMYLKYFLNNFIHIYICKFYFYHHTQPE